MDILRRYSKLFVIGGFLLWLVVGFLPMIFFHGKLEEAGQFGDSFGTATSLFTGVSFAFALIALIMQIEESHEAGERQLKQEELDTRQVELQAEQARIAERTAQLQESIRKDGQRESALQVLRKTYADALHFERSIVHYAGVRMKHPEGGALIGEQSRFNQAESELLSNRFTLELVFGEMEAATVTSLIDDLVGTTGSWPQLLKGGEATLELRGKVLKVCEALRHLWKKVSA